MKKWIWLFAILPIAAFQMGCRHLISSEIRSTTEYKLGMDAFRTSSRAHELLGDHLDTADGNPREHSYTSDGNGNAELDVPVSGSRQKGTLYIKGTEESGQWHIDELALRLDGQSNWNELFPSVSR